MHATPLPRQTHRLASSRSSTATSTAAPPLPSSTAAPAALSLSRSSDAGDTSPAADPKRSLARLPVVYEEDEEPMRLVPNTGSKTLRINMDLSLWRSRTRRINAAMSLDKEERRRLLKEGEDQLRRCLALDPSDPRAYVVLGKLLVQQKRYEEARKLYAEGTAATANNSPFIWSSWGWLEFKTGNVAAARKLFDAAVVVDETHACAWHKWGMLERSEGNFMRARDLWMQGIQKCRRKPQNQIAYLYNALAVMASQVGRVEEARAWFEEGTRTLEGAASVALWQAWAVLEAKQGDPTAVRYLFKRALGVNPKSRYVHLAWAMWEQKQGNTSLCTQLLQRGNTLNPTDPAIYQAWAILERKRGDYERAAALFEGGLKADPNHVHLWQAWGCMEAERGNLDRARELFQQGVWADPNSRNTLYVFHAWAVLEKRAGNAGLARELFKAAIKIDPKNDNVWSTWIAMEEEMGFLDKADDLRIRQAEQQWEFEVPFNFTTRPTESPLAGLVDTLSKFFLAREQGQGRRSGGPVASGNGGKRTLRDLLPDDFDENLSAEDIIPTLMPAQMPSRQGQSLEDALFEQQQSARQVETLQQRESERREREARRAPQARPMGPIAAPAMAATGTPAAGAVGAEAAPASLLFEEDEDEDEFEFENGRGTGARKGQQGQQRQRGVQATQVAAPAAMPALLQRPQQQQQQ